MSDTRRHSSSPGHHRVRDGQHIPARRTIQVRWAANPETRLEIRNLNPRKTFTS